MNTPSVVILTAVVVVIHFTVFVCLSGASPVAPHLAGNVALVSTLYITFFTYLSHVKPIFFKLCNFKKLRLHVKFVFPLPHIQEMS